MCRIQSWLTTAENFRDILLKIILSENANIWHKRYAMNACTYMKMSEKLGQWTLRIKSSVLPNYEKDGNQQRKSRIFPKEEDINKYALNKPVDCHLYCIQRSTFHDCTWR